MNTQKVLYSHIGEGRSIDNVVFSGKNLWIVSANDDHFFTWNKECKCTYDFEIRGFRRLHNMVRISDVIEYEDCLIVISPLENKSIVVEKSTRTEKAIDLNVLSENEVVATFGEKVQVGDSWLLLPQNTDSFLKILPDQSIEYIHAGIRDDDFCRNYFYRFRQDVIKENDNYGLRELIWGIG